MGGDGGKALRAAALGDGVSAAAAPRDQVAGLLSAVLTRERTGEPSPPLTSDMLSAMLDESSTPLLVIDRDLGIKFANSSARLDLVSGEIFIQRDDRLHLGGSDAEAFTRTVGAACRGCPRLATMVVSGANGDRAAVWMRPFAASLQTSSPLWSKGLVRVRFRVLGRGLGPAAAMLHTHFNLTMAEIAVLSALVGGASIDEIAVLRGKAHDTIAGQIKSCMKKTQTRRQSHLVALALALMSPVLEP